MPRTRGFLVFAWVLLPALLLSGCKEDESATEERPPTAAPVWVPEAARESRDAPAPLVQAAQTLGSSAPSPGAGTLERLRRETPLYTNEDIEAASRRWGQVFDGAPRLVSAAPVMAAAAPPSQGGAARLAAPQARRGARLLRTNIPSPRFPPPPIRVKDLPPEAPEPVPPRTEAVFEAFRQAFHAFQRAANGAVRPLLSREDWGAKSAKGGAAGQEPRRIVVHHTGEPAHFTRDPERTRRWVTSIQTNHMRHMEREGRGPNLDDIGYHFLIGADGTIYEGRWRLARGAHAGEQGNHDSIGIALLGEFTTHSPSGEQTDALIKLMAFLAREHRIDTKAREFLEGHDHYSPGRDCPGQRVERLIPAFRDTVRTLLQSPTPAPVPTIVLADAAS